MAFLPGQIVYHDYGEHPRCIHTRLILGHVTGFEYLIQTPDNDIYVEVCDPSNIDLAHFYVGPDDGSLPVGIPPGSVYGFMPMTVAQLNGYLAAGRVELANELGRRGLAQPVPVGGGAVFQNPMVWVLAEYVPGHKVGERIIPAPVFSSDGTWGLASFTDSEGNTRPTLIHQVAVDDIPRFCEERVQLARATVALEGEDTHAGEDARTLEVKYAPSGERQRSFKETVAELQQVEFDDWPLEPRTAMSYLRAVSTVAESAFVQHLSWIQQSRILKMIG